MSEALANILNEVTRVEGIEVAFSSLLVHRKEDQSKALEKIENSLADYFHNLNPDYLENALRQYFRVMFQCSPSQMEILSQLLEHCIKKGILQPRKTCEVIISSNQLHYNAIHFWICCFKLLRKILNLVDYKGVRDVLKGCYEKARELPLKLTVSTHNQLKAYKDVVSDILNRETCLLPGYLVVSELQKPYPFPHWSVADMFSNYIESFRPCAQIVSIIGLTHMRPMVKYSGCSEYLLSQWRLDPVNLTFFIKRGLPYDPELLERNTDLLRYMLLQPFGRDMVCVILGLNKHHAKERYQVIEEQLAELIVQALEKSDIEGEETDRMWAHLSSQVICFILFNHASFPSMINILYGKLQGKDFRRGRDYLMWMLLQFISGSILRVPLSAFVSVIKLYDLLFPEQDLPLPVPDFCQPQCARQMAMICIWLHLMRKAKSEQTKVHWPLPTRLRQHHEFLNHLLPPNNASFGVVPNDYRIALLCNAISASADTFAMTMSSMVDIGKSNPKPGMSTNVQGSLPLSLDLLDSLTIHAKMTLTHYIVTQIIKLATSKSGLSLSPAVLETYSRLLVYIEIESIGVKGFIGQLLPQVYKNHAWGIMYNLMEMFSYRMYHMQPHYRVQILSHLHSLASGPQMNQPHLFLCVETAALKLIAGLSNHDVQPELSRFLADTKAIISTESEELNRTLVRTLARATLATRSDGAWCLDMLSSITQSTQHVWDKFALACFPKPMQDFFNQQSYLPENKQLLKKAVDEESRKWASMSNENDMMSHFGAKGTPLFLCLLYRTLLEGKTISPIAYKILERIGARALSNHMRKFCDLLIYEFTNQGQGPNQGGHSEVNKRVDTVNDMMWKYNMLTIDRLVLCLTLRTQDISESQVCAFIIQLLLLKATEFRNRVSDFVKDISPDHWNHSNWYDKHLEFQKKYPEKFAWEEQPSGYQPYFGNICLRFLPVFDIVLHRFIEIEPVQKSLEILLEHLGCLYKFHNRPVGFLYDTLHYYDEMLRKTFMLKKKLCFWIMINHRDDLSPYLQRYLADSDNTITGIPDLEYYIGMVRRVVNVINGTTSPFSKDWRYSEFPNAVTHTIYVSCVELLTLPVEPEHIIKGLFDVTLKGHVIIPLTSIHEWINAIGLIISSLPKTHFDALLDHLMQAMVEMEPWAYVDTAFKMFNFKETHLGYLNTKYSYMIAMAHAIFHHSCPGQIISLVDWIKDRLLLVVQTEEQFLFVCHLVGPFLQRLNPVLQTLTTTLYHLLSRVDSHQQKQQEMRYIDPICDFFYHIKYMYGDFVNPEVENIIRKLNRNLQKRLRFMGNINLDESTTTSQQ